ncbi:hypothetical protein [Gordonia terrae]|nr:hypothetical protein [Gordonia terrae]GAB43811.1 hypothetical protein GOTRE_052_00170 [Gordonia terrae NBRC 100016]VTR08472.1 Uncharacterised protein [Clostridioides difficile]VTS63737.1 Uncharacterised protein [Gordonia terrae]
MTTRDWLVAIPALIAALSPFLHAEPGSRVARRQDARIRTLSEQAETIGLRTAVRQTLQSEANDLIAWEAARRKYPSRGGFWPAYLMFVVFAIAYLGLSFAGLMGNTSLEILTWTMWAGLLFSVVALLRVVLRTAAETTRVRLCKATDMGDIDFIDPLFSTRRTMINAFKLPRYRDEEIAASATTVILRRAHLRQLRDDGVDTATMELIQTSLPALSDYDRWTAMAPRIGCSAINATIRELNRS